MAKRLYALDTLRGFAALSVVIWHWQHFFALSGTWQPGWQRSSEPFYPFLKLFYDQGWAAVDLFFALSGFIFFWLYSKAIAGHRIGAGRFAWLRFSRLYPLHLVTLLMVAVLQYFFWHATGHFFVYETNNWKHFVSSLVFAQQWLPPTLHQSFNGPSWSVSIEVGLYCVFFVFCQVGFRGLRTALCIALLSIPLLWADEFIGRGLMGFFAGGAAFHISGRIATRPDARRLAQIMVGVALALWSIIVLEVYLGPMHAFLHCLTGDISPADMGLNIALNRDLFLVLFILIVSPVTIMALALNEQVMGASWHRFAFVGDISYSTYMLHFPLQLALALIAVHYALTPAAFQNPLALILFYVVLIVLGGLSFHYFERPMQNLLRNMLPKKVDGAGELNSAAPPPMSS